MVSATINGGLSGGIFDNNLSLVLISKLSVRVLLEVNLDVLLYVLSNLSCLYNLLSTTKYTFFL